MNKKYNDVSAIIQVIGNIYQHPNLLDNDNYNFIEEDFVEDFHRVLFGSIYNLYNLGAKEINVNVIEDYLSQRPKNFATYKSFKGREYLEKISSTTQLSTFEYYYKRMKKMTLLRMYDDIGVDLTWLYDIDNILDIKKKQAQEDWLDNHSIDDIAEIINQKINEIKMKYVDGTTDNFVQAGDNIIDLVNRLKEKPEIGYPLFSPLINTVTRGARLKKFYLRSAATGVRKD